MSVYSQQARVVSGMRATGNMHLGHLYGVLKNWLTLQNQYECFYFVADLHGLTTHYAHSKVLHDSLWETIVDWLAVGINPGSAHIIIQSWVPEITELHVILSMVAPLAWIERVPTYREQQEKLKNLDLATYGFLGYPILQAADVLIYKGQYVPVGEDQIPHVELVREIARRFNFLYGREPDFVNLAEQVLNKLGKKQAALFRTLRKQFQEQGDEQSLAQAQAMIEIQQTLSLGDKERLLGYLEGSGKQFLPEPQVLLTQNSKFPGLDGQKMSKSYGNTINLRDEPEVVRQKIQTMPTDPARVRRTDKGNPGKCPVWQFHSVYSSSETKAWVQEGCTTAGIGCLECKKPIIDAIVQELKPIQQAIKDYTDDLNTIKKMVSNSTEAAREVTKLTLKEVKTAVGLEYD